ncbi:hypothetical protein C7212DRAFT_356630 [Tuber magnatum]|uniref:Uncharacterized protein n=1 Tax=Tuber magnatum TaxID=42249 RepID=A0A317SYQ6_9PEZI|nr:hypothetical protein C7212DRAFT_356630 [Tuber magnatum]
MRFSSVAVSAAVVTWICSTAANGLTIGPEVGGGDDSYVRPAPILPLEKMTAREQDPCTYFSQNHGRVTGEDWRKCILAVPFNEPFARPIIGALRMKAKINSRAYQNHWSFEYDLMVLFNRYRGGHTSLNTMCMREYYWIYAYPIVLFEEEVQGNKVWEAWTVEKDWSMKNWHGVKLGGRIVMINGQPALEWLA